MSPRPATRTAGGVLLLVIGLSGFFAAAGLVAMAPHAADLAPGVLSAGIGVALVIGAYSAAATAAGIGILLGRGWAWWVGVVTIVVGLALLALSLAAVGELDPVLTFGVLVWTVTLAFLVAPATRRSIGGR